MATFDELVSGTQKSTVSFSDLIAQTGGGKRLSFDELINGVGKVQEPVPVTVEPVGGPAPEIIAPLQNVDPSFFPDFGGGSFDTGDIAAHEKQIQQAIDEESKKKSDGEIPPTEDITSYNFPDFARGDSITYDVDRGIKLTPFDVKMREMGLPTAGETAMESDPLVDPLMVMTGAFGASSSMALKASLKAGKPIIDSLITAGGRGILASVVSGIGEFAIASPTSLIEETNPRAALVLNISLGIFSGLTIENALERYVLKNMPGASTDELAKAMSNGIKFLNDNADIVAKSTDEIGGLSPEKLDELLGIQDFGKENKEIAKLFGDIELNDVKKKLVGLPELSGESAEASAETFLRAEDQATKVSDFRSAVDPSIARQENEAMMRGRGYITDLDSSYGRFFSEQGTEVAGMGQRSLSNVEGAGQNITWKDVQRLGNDQAINPTVEGGVGKGGLVTRDLGDGWSGTTPLVRQRTELGGSGGVGIPKATDPEFDFFPKRTAEDFTVSPVDEVKRFFKTDSYNAAKSRLSAFFSGNTLRSGVDPEALKDFVIVGGHHLENGIHDFGKWSKKMVDDFGPNIEPFLREIYDNSVDTMVKASIRLEPTRIEREEIPVLASRMGATPEEGEQLRKYAGSINLNRIDSPDSIKFHIQRVQDDNAEAFSKITRGKITNEETVRRAQTSGVSEKVLKKMLKKQGSGQILNAEDATALRMLHAKSTDDTLKLTAIARETEAPEDIANALAAVERHRIIQAANSGIASEQGRALQARNILVNPEDIAAKNFNKLLDKVGGKELALEKLLRLSQIDPTDVVAINKFIREVSDVSTSDKIFEAWVNALLSSPTTHSVNILSNALTFLSRFPEKGLSATVDAFSTAVTGKPRSRFFGEVAAEMVGSVSGLKVGSKQFLRSFVNEMSSDSFSKLELGGRHAIKGKTGKVVRLPGRFLIAADEFFKGLNRTAELHALAFRQATKEGNIGKAKIRRMSQILADPSEEMSEKAFISARYRTFQQELSPQMRSISGLRLSDDVAWGKVKYIIPFVRTPVNIVKFSLERTPLAFLDVVRKHVNSIPITKGTQSDKIGKAVWGTALGYWAYDMATEGKITGAGPKEPAKREALYNTGWMPYSIKIRDKYYSYGRLEPLGSILGMSADLYEGLDEMADNEKGDLAARMIRSFGTNLTSKTFLRGVSDMMAAVNDPERHAQRWIDNFVGTAVPRIVATAARAKDRYLRESDSTSEYLQSQVPLWAEQLYPRRDRWGNRVERQGTQVQRMFSPIRSSPIKGTEADREIVRLNASIQKVRNNWMGIELKPEQYDTLAYAAGNRAEGMVLKYINSEFKSLSREPEARKVLDELGASERYEKADDFVKKDIIENIYSAGTSIARRKLFRIERDDKGKPIALNPTKFYNETRAKIKKLEKD